MKIYQIKVTIFYEGNRSQGDIGILTIQLETDENLIMQSRNSYEVEGQRDIIPVNITTIYGIVKNIEKINIKPHDFEYEVTNEHLKLRIKGWHVYYKTELVEL